MPISLIHANHTRGNLAPETYTLKFGPSNLAEGGLTAILIDNYQDTTYDISLDEDTEISFVVDSNATSMAGRFTLVFNRASFSKMAHVSEKPFQDVFPNPVTNGEFFVELNNKISGTYNIQVVNSTGQVILKQRVSQAENNKTIKVNLGNAIASGIYHVIISDEKGNKTTRHIIVR
ncbi:MAG: T9SS type A sorting domain-containing protein [Ferruginibacter sp.]